MCAALLWSASIVLHGVGEEPMGLRAFSGHKLSSIMSNLHVFRNLLTTKSKPCYTLVDEM